MIVKLLLSLSLISAIASMKSKSSVNARFAFCFFALFSSLLLLAFEKFWAFALHLLLLGMLAPTSVALLEDKCKIEFRAKKKGARALILAALLALLLIFLLSLGASLLETISLSAIILTGLYGALLARSLMKRFFGVLIVEGGLLSWWGALANARLLIASPIVIFCSILAIAYTVKHFA
ncbi:TPA: hypothetical protein EYP26_03325 [Candidatus Bathyarchaeota archaeon]|nr:hypothetical protein [Candidatus Bathyarchaeota archaeon]